MRRILLLLLAVCVVQTAAWASDAPSVQAAPQARVSIGICFEGGTSGDWVPPSGYGSGTMKGTLFTVRPFRGATLYHLQARTTGELVRGSINGWLISTRGERIASVRGSYWASTHQRYKGEWKVTIYPIQSLSQIGDRRHYRLPGRMNGTYDINPMGFATTFEGRFRLCL